MSRCDPAHVFGVGPYPHMCYNQKNVVLLNRYSHECLDSCRDPIRGTPISREERDEWWKKIVGEELYECLEKEAYSRGDKYGAVQEEASND